MPYQLGDTPIRNFDNSLVFATSPILLYFLVSCFLFLVSRCRLVGISAWIANLPLLFTDSKALQLTVPLPYYPND